MTYYSNNITSNNTALMAIVEAVQVVHPQAFSTFGQVQEVSVLPPQMYQQSHQEAPANPLLEALMNWLYANFYMQAPTDMPLNIVPEKIKEERAQFMEQLSAKNNGKTGWEYGWQLKPSDGHSNQLFAQKGGRYRALKAGDFEYLANTHQAIRVQHLREKKSTKEAFYFVFGNQAETVQAGLFRLYFNIKSEGAAALVEAISNLLNQYYIPFQFKCLNHPAFYTRRDAAVLYVDKSRQRIIADLLPQIVEAISPYLEEEVPLFAQKIARGIGFAEDPEDGQSFGMHRMRCVAEGIVKAFYQQQYLPKQRLQFIQQNLQQHGLNLEELHLNAQAKYPYKWN